jgi:hypothetical protein
MQLAHLWLSAGLDASDNGLYLAELHYWLREIVDCAYSKCET